MPFNSPDVPWWRWSSCLAVPLVAREAGAMAYFTIPRVGREASAVCDRCYRTACAISDKAAIIGFISTPVIIRPKSSNTRAIMRIIFAVSGSIPFAVPGSILFRLAFPFGLLLVVAPGFRRAWRPEIVAFFISSSTNVG